MRHIAIILAALAATSPATAQGWQEYAYPNYFFSVAFPAEPKIETTTYQTSEGRAVEARIYSVANDTGIFKMTIADLSNASVPETAVIGHAVKSMSEGGEIKVDIAHRIRRVYGRQLTITNADGHHLFVAVFYHKQRLYQIEGKALTGGDEAMTDALRFQQSLDFTENASNRATPGGKAERQGRPPRRI